MREERISERKERRREKERLVQRIVNENIIIFILLKFGWKR